MGYECNLWGQYSALVDAPQKDVHGVVYHVESEKDDKRLASYETNNSQADSCHIYYDDGNTPHG